MSQHGTHGGSTDTWSSRSPAFDFSIHDVEDGKKISVLKKNLGMTKYMYAWMKHVQEKHAGDTSFNLPESGSYKK